MALYCNLCKSYKAAILPSYTLLKFIHKNVENRTVILEVDTIDEFTSQLIQKKNSKWEHIQAKSKCLPQQRNHLIGKTKNHLEYPPDLWKEAVDERNITVILDILDHYVKTDKPPPKDVIISTVQILADYGKIEAIVQVKTLCENHFPDLLKMSANFDLYSAEALWNQGDVKNSLALFQELYVTSRVFQRPINSALKYLFLNTLKNRSEAVLVLVVKFCEQFHRNHQDIFLLSVLWQMCFLSEWFRDQNICFDLIEGNEELRKTVLLRVPFLVTVALNNHQTDVVYRLLEFLLRYELKMEYSSVLQCLFDYKSKLKNRCNSIKIFTLN